MTKMTNATPTDPVNYPSTTTSSVVSFAERFEGTATEMSGFCLGVDPSPELLKDWSLPVSDDGLTEFVSIALEAADRSVGIIKPQVAFFEAFGVPGMVELDRLISGARERGLLVIADAKRSDIGSSMSAYARAWLGEEGFNADAVTATAYLGVGALTPLLETARQRGRAVFVVVRSSNPEGQELQSADMKGVPLADRLAKSIREENERLLPEAEIGPIGAVIGATLGIEAGNTARLMPNALFLVPGLGAQGGIVRRLEADFRRRSAAAGDCLLLACGSVGRAQCVGTEGQPFPQRRRSDEVAQRGRLNASVCDDSRRTLANDKVRCYCVRPCHTGPCLPACAAPTSPRIKRGHGMAGFLVPQSTAGVFELIPW